MELRDPDEADPTGDRRHRLRWSNHSLSESPPTRQMTSLPSPVVSTPKTTTTAASPSADGSSSSLVLSPGCRSHSSPSALMGPDDAATLESDDTARKEGSPSMGVNDDEGPERESSAISLDPAGLGASAKIITGPPSPSPSSDIDPSSDNDLLDTASPPPPPPPPFPSPIKAAAAASLTPMKFNVVCSPRSSAVPDGTHHDPFFNGSLVGGLPPMTDDVAAETTGTGDASTPMPSESAHAEARGHGMTRTYSSTMPGPCSFPGGPATPWQPEGAQNRRRHQATAVLCSSSLGSLGTKQHQGSTSISFDDSNNNKIIPGDEGALAEAAADLSDGGVGGASWHLPSGLIATPEPSPPSQRLIVPPPCWDDRTQQPLQPSISGGGGGNGTSRCTTAMTQLQQRLNFDNDEMAEHHQKPDPQQADNRPNGTVVVTPVPSAMAAPKAKKSTTLFGDGRGDIVASSAAMPIMRMNSSPCPGSTAISSAATPLVATAKPCWERGWTSPTSSLAAPFSGPCRSLSSQWPGPGAAIINDDWIAQQQQQQKPRHQPHHLLPGAPAEAPHLHHQGFGLEHVPPHSGSSSRVNASEETTPLSELASAGSSPAAISAAASPATASFCGGNMAPLMSSMPIMTVPGGSGANLCGGSGGRSCFEGTSAQYMITPHQFSSAFSGDNPGGAGGISQPQQQWPHLLQHGYAPQQQQQQCSLAHPAPPPPPPPLQQEQQQQQQQQQLHLPGGMHRHASPSPHLPMFGDGYSSGPGPQQAVLPGILSSGNQFNMPLMMPGYQQHRIGAAHQYVAPEWPSQLSRSHSGGNGRARIHPSQVQNNNFSAYQSQQQPSSSFSSGFGLGAMASPAPPLTAANTAGSALPHQYISHHHQYQATDILPQQMTHQSPQLHHQQQMQHPSPSIHRGFQTCDIGIEAAPAASAMSQLQQLQQQNVGDQLTALMMPAPAGFTSASTAAAMSPHPSSMYLKPIANKVDVRKWMASNLP